MSSTQAAQLVAGQPAVAVEHRGSQLTGVDRDVPTVAVAGQRLQLDSHTVDERIDVLAEDPGHARHRTRTPPPTNRWVFHDGSVMKTPIGRDFRSEIGRYRSVACAG